MHLHGGSISLLDCLFRHHSKLHSPLQGSLNLTLHKSQVSVHQGSPLMHESFPESSVRTGRVFGPVGQFFMHQGASLEHLRSLRPRAEQTLDQDIMVCYPNLTAAWLGTSRICTPPQSLGPGRQEN